MGIEGLKRQWGVHAAGVIMSSEPLLDVIPLMRRPQDGAIITQFDYPTCERLGLIKMDFLGLRNLTVLDDALVNIERNRGEQVVLEDLALDDPATYQLLARGDTLGVFQLDGGPMRALLRLDAPRLLRGHLRGAARSTGPARWAPTRHNKYARRKNGKQEIGADPPRARRAAGGDPGRDLRPDRLPGAGAWRSRRSWPATRSARPTCCAGRWARRRSAMLDKQFETFSGGHARARLLRGRRSRRCGTSCCRSPTTPSTRPTPRRTAWSPTGPPTSRPTTPPSTWPRCSPRSRTTRTSRRSTSTSAAG